MQYTEESNKIVDAVQNTQDNIIIEAKAGAGKTTQLLRIHQECDLGDARFLAFNKAIADELVVKGVPASTMHSLGVKICKQNAPFFKINGNKTKNILRYKLKLKLEYREERFLEDLVATMKRSLMQVCPQTEEQYEVLLSLADKDPIIPTQKCISLLEQIWKWQDLEKYKVLDFEDLITYPLFKQWKFPAFDTVLVDEAQDLNYAQHEFLMRLRGEGARIIAVGDSRQSIYGFRGSRSNSMGKLKRHFDCREFTLSYSFRCSPAVCREAQKIEPGIKPYFEHEGEVKRDVSLIPELRAQEPETKTKILCRLNAPLVECALDLQRAGIPCYIVGRDLAQSLIKRVKRDFHTTFEGVRRERDKCLEKNWKKQAETFQMYLNIFCILQKRGVEEKDELKETVQKLFSKEGVPLMTIHKSKGLEADNVYLIRPDLVPFKFGEPEQERNLEYVAITRAKYNYATVREI